MIKLFTFNRKGLTALMIVLCMSLQMLFPLFVFSDVASGSIVNGDTIVPMTVSPESNELGLMVNAADMAKAFSIDYVFDSKNKAFVMYTEQHGKIILMHNATTFSSGENIYRCSPSFYVMNGMPMVESGFFCTMFASDYSYDEISDIITIHSGRVSVNIPRIIYGDSETPLYIEPVSHSEKGLVVVATDMAAAFGVEYEYDSATRTATLTSDDGTFVELKDGATTFKSSFGEFECAELFFIENNLPFVNVDFFCDLYGVSYNYDKATKCIVIDDSVTLCDLVDAQAEKAAMELMSDCVVSGTVNLQSMENTQGLNVKIILQQVGRDGSMYFGYSYYVGNTYNLGSVYLNPGQTQASYSFEISQYKTSNYPFFSLYYSIPTVNEHGYYTYYGSTANINYPPDEYSYYLSSAADFEYSSGISVVDFNINCRCLDGSFILPSNVPTDYGNLDVELILQTRSQTYGGMYGQEYYYHASNVHTLGTTTLSGSNRSADFKYFISPYFVNGEYNYYSLFYKATPANGNANYGYVNSNGTISTCTNAPQTGVCYDTDAYMFTLSDSNSVDFYLPASAGGNLSGGGGSAEEYRPTLKVWSADARQGGLVDVTVSVENNPGFAAIIFGLDYDSTAMELYEVSYAYALADGFVPGDFTKIPYKFVAYTTRENFTENGFLARFTFRINDNCPSGDYDVSINGVDCCNINEEIVDFKCCNGQIRVIEYVAGDVNGDGILNRQDLQRLANYLAGWDVEITDRADVNGDGFVSVKDLLRLAKYFAGWDVELV